MECVETYGLFEKVNLLNSLEEIACHLGLHENTVNRWREKKSVPIHYHGDFRRMLGEEGSPVDQFYTLPEVAEKCFETLQNVMKELNINPNNYWFIEPSAGCGFFHQILPEGRRIGIDLDPRYEDEEGDIEQADYLLWKPDVKRKYAVIGNPPFGLRGHLALQFINHSAKFSDIVGFILPQLFESDGKGVPSKRVNSSFKLAYSESLPPDSFCDPTGKKMSISTIFQVWTRIRHKNIKLEPRKTCKDYIRVYSLSDGGTPASTRNKNMIGKCDIYLPSTCFTGMQSYKSFEKLPNNRGYGIVIHKNKREIKKLIANHNWVDSAFPSTNGALNLRTSLIEDVITEKGYYDGK